MKLPKFLKVGDTIGLVAPSFGANIEPYKSRLESGINLLKEKGFKIKVFGDLFGYYKGASSSKENRAKSFMDAYTDETVTAIWSVSGGQMMYEILPLLDFELLKNYPPKFFIGYSDNTNLTFLLPVMLDTISVYAPCLTTFGMKPLDPFLINTLDLLMGKNIKQYKSEYHEPLEEIEKDPLAPYTLTEKTKWVNLFGEQKIHLKGRVIGGCLDVLFPLIKTPFDQVDEFIIKYKEDHIIWFLEAAEVNIFNYKKALWQMKEAGWFKNAKGILFGRTPSAIDFIDLTLFEVTKDVLKDLNIPIIMDMDIGHISPMLTMFTGSMIEVYNDEKESFVEFNLSE